MLFPAEPQCLVANVQRGVHVPVMPAMAVSAGPFAFGQPQSLVLVPAVVAEFGTRVEPVHLDEDAAIPFRLVGELVHEAAPPVAEYGTVHRAFA